MTRRKPTDSQPSLWDMAAGRTARDQGMDAAVAHADDAWKSAFLAEAERLLLARLPAHTEAVVAVVGMPPPGTHHNTVGALWGKLIRKHHLRRVAITTSQRTKSHAAALMVWALPE